MGKFLRLTDKATNKTYTLEFNRKAVETMERQGFNISEFAEKPMTTLPALFRGAFLMHHPATKREVVDNLFDQVSNKRELINKLAEMYTETLDVLLYDDENDENEGKVEWEASF